MFNVVLILIGLDKINAGCRAPFYLILQAGATAILVDTVFALTNFGIQTFEVAEPVYPFLAEFDRRYISGHMGVIKPDQVIYQMVEDDCGVPPGGLLFADDRIDNIKVAAARGWQTHLFEGSQGWADRLVAEGLLSKEAAL